MIKEFISLTGYEVEAMDQTRDERWILNRYLDLLADFKKGGKFPILVSLDDILLEKFVIDLEDQGLEANPAGFRQLVARYLDRAGEVDLDQVFPPQDKADIVAEMDFESLEKPDEGYELELMSISDYNGHLKDKLLIVKLDIKNPYEAFAYLPMGGFNDCPCPEVMVAASKYWYEKFGALPCALSYDEVEYYVEERFTDISRIKDLTAEHYIYDVDIVDQGLGTLEALATCFYDNNQWYFWWD